LTASGAVEGNRDGFLLGIVIRREHGQRLVQFSVQGRIGQFDALHVRQRERAESLFCQERDIFLFDDAVL
jgi:hypothetical protein